VAQLADEAGPNTVFLLDSRIPLPGMSDANELEQHMLRLRNMTPASWQRPRDLPATAIDELLPDASLPATGGN
jgi:hypothetical protein